jgi:hypothetical protein
LKRAGLTREEFRIAESRCKAPSSLLKNLARATEW